MHSSPDPLIQIRPASFGNGLFATKNLPVGCIVCRATGSPLTFAETLQLGERESHTLQIDNDKYILCDAPFLYSNHSCEPNCGLNENLELETLRVISKDEELLWDYSTSMLERHWTMQCLCGAKNCRKIITDFDLLPKDIQTAYLHKRIVLPFIACQFLPNLQSEAFRA